MSNPSEAQRSRISNIQREIQQQIKRQNHVSETIAGGIILPEVRGVALNTMQAGIQH